MNQVERGGGGGGYATLIRSVPLPVGVVRGKTHCDSAVSAEYGCLVAAVQSSHGTTR